MNLFETPRLTGKYIHKTLASGWLTSGARCQELQEATAAFLGCRPEQVVLAASATAGWQGVLDLLRSRSDFAPLRVRIAEATWPGMHLSIKHAGCIQLPPGNAHADVTVDTDIGGRRYIDTKDGTPPPVPDILVHDACHSWLPDPGAEFGLVSFYPTKLAPGAEGGAVVCKRAEDAEQLRLWLYCGMRPGGAGRGEPPAVPGRKANMTDVTAALNLEALELASKYIDDIEHSWAILAQRFGWAQIEHLVRQQPVRPYLFQVVVDPARIPALMKALPYPTAWNFPPAGLLTLPCYPGLTPGTAHWIMTEFAKAHGGFGKIADYKERA